MLRFRQIRAGKVKDTTRLQQYVYSCTAVGGESNLFVPNHCTRDLLSRLNTGSLTASHTGYFVCSRVSDITVIVVSLLLSLHLLPLGCQRRCSSRTSYTAALRRPRNRRCGPNMPRRHIPLTLNAAVICRLLCLWCDRPRWRCRCRIQTRRRFWLIRLVHLHGTVGRLLDQSIVFRCQNAVDLHRAEYVLHLVDRS